MADSIAVQMQRILDDYGKEVKNASRTASQKVARNTAKKLRNVSPKKTGDYAGGWASKQLDADTFVVYNRKAPGLTHLLEKGHVIRNKKGTYGRAPAHVHIAPVAQEAEQEFIDMIERELS